MSITDARLAELAATYDRISRLSRSQGLRDERKEIADALRELQQLRKASQQKPILHQAAGVRRCYSCGDPLIENFHRCKPGAKRQGNIF